MTAPEQPRAQDNTDPSYTEPTGEAAAIAALLTLWLALPSAHHVLGLPRDLVQRLVGLGLVEKAVVAAARIATTDPVAGVGRRAKAGPLAEASAADQLAEDEPRMRALYILNAARRLSVAIRAGVPTVAALRNERRNFELSLAAGRRRAAAARAVDAAAKISPWLEWRAVLDSRTTPDCAAMHGRIFTLDNPPHIGFPGAVHPRCRCTCRPYGVAEFGAQPTVRRPSQIGV